MPDSLEAVVSTVLDCLAAAVPNLQQLSLGEGCRGSATRAFGLHCPQLTSLEVDIHSEPAAALQHVSQHLPHLTEVTFRGDRNIASISCSLDASISQLQQCALLRVLRIDYDNGALLSGGGSWPLLPASLEEYSCNCVTASGAMPLTSSARLKRLTGRDFDGKGSLCAFLLAHPLMENLHVLGCRSGCFLKLLDGDEPNPDPRSNVHPVRERFEAGFELTCAEVTLKGSSEEVGAALAWLPPLPSVTTVSLDLDGTSHCNCLQPLKRVFPNIESLHMSDGQQEYDVAPAGSDVELLSPLLACTGLKHLYLFIHANFTTKWLFQLCRGLPVLQSLKYVERRGVDFALLKGALPLVDREIRVDYYSASDFMDVNIDVDDGVDAVDFDDDFGIAVGLEGFFAGPV
ncbi:MAG: hypothetical protein WDW38_005304 [Sanguina aurantia]